MIVSVHQPQYLPWLGYFAKINASDTFVFLDTVQYKKREFQNRNRIRTDSGWLWLTVPVITKEKYEQAISEVRIDTAVGWQKKHWMSLSQNYSRAPYFSLYRQFFEELYMKKWEKLIDLNVCIIEYLLKCFGIDRKIYFESTMSITTKSTDRIIDICRYLKADTYLSGTGGRNYLDEEKFKASGIKLKYQEFIHPQYPQVCSGFEPCMSAIDALFNMGEKSAELIHGRNSGIQRKNLDKNHNSDENIG